MYIARQAILNRTLKVFGYELLYRKGESSYSYDGMSATCASASVLGGLFESGINQIVEDKPAFINFDDELLQSDALELINPGQLVIEVLENIRVDTNLVERIKGLKQKGYKIALDDFYDDLDSYPLVPYSDIIKFDLIATPLPTITDAVEKALGQKKILLAEKIETQEEFLLAKKMGFHLFQGYFFSKPVIVKQSAGNATLKSQYIRLKNELGKEEPSYQALAEIIEKDADLAYRLIKVSSRRSGSELIYSIKQALAYMGLKEIERWISIMMLRDLNHSKPDELMRISLIRTKFAELLAVHSKYKKMKYEASIMGLFSTIDAMLGQKMEDALDHMALPESITDALIHGKGVLYPVYRMMTAYETGDWMTAEGMSREIGISEQNLSSDYLAALQWTSEIMKAIS